MNLLIEFLLAEKPRWAYTLDILITAYLIARTKDTMECSPTLADLMAASGAQHTPIRASLARLEQNGWITITSEGKRRPKTYVVRFANLPK